MKELKQMPEEADEKTNISLYEFYVIGINSLLVKAPWELERSVSAYHESFLTEQRCLGLAILLLLGEEHVPRKAVNSLPGFEDQIRTSVNQAVFLRALRHYFEEMKLETNRADIALERMQSYLVGSRNARSKKQDPLVSMLETMCKRVPPKDKPQRILYEARVEKIYDYIEGLVENNLLKRYIITE